MGHAKETPRSKNYYNGMNMKTLFMAAGNEASAVMIGMTGTGPNTVWI